jgi:hypothetical protein
MDRQFFSFEAGSRSRQGLVDLRLTSDADMAALARKRFPFGPFREAGLYKRDYEPFTRLAGRRRRLHDVVLGACLYPVFFFLVLIV